MDGSARDDVPKLKYRTFGDNSKTKTEIFCLRHSLDGQFLAAGIGDGTIRIFNTDAGKVVYQLIHEGTGSLPTTCIRFRPLTAASKTKNVLLAAGADGMIRHWHVTSGKCLHTIKEENNQIYAIDYRYDGLKFVTCGMDYKVRVYDEATKTLMCTMQGGFGKSRPGHSNRVFSAKFLPGSENLFLTAGWDNTVQIWDLRVDTSVRSIFGVHICGDAIDFYDNTVLTGSWRPKDQIQLWDFDSCELIESIPWTTNPSPNKESCMLYAAQFSPASDRASLIAAGGSGLNEMKIFNRHSKLATGTTGSFTRGIYSLDFHPSGSAIAAAGGDGVVYYMNK
mmetsp:Transcript_6026/g.10357  ORF Transcript_6026/g.10357 Transcript_6026/m.10357 type:complete len:336 (-) Transcript_6026:268-1275(-)|eukprot:CAMPEP_0196660562 /NCGR_PEP_ID=MMETSP1086-20130531/40362_1 /TAXON_ID=77921 /ORGANISM="Cyanoptyche  gloeocystis , Strain SAG4.97" /LENGTH=335 /DNA_ID=CAMNT_0041995037 /DNA_START=57 /DNA_END=1064 /DNA_ORIENTATION=+